MAVQCCANWIPGQGCLIHRLGKCVLAAQEPCGYFERSVLPLTRIVARYGRVVPQYNKIKDAWAKDAPKREAALLASFGRREGVKPPDCRCLNCRNGHRQICLSTLKLKAVAPEAPKTGRMVLRYCLKCKAPIFVAGARVCSEQCRRALARLARQRAREQRHGASSLHNDRENIGRFEANQGVLALQPKLGLKEA
jgi:hypothetical protein